MVAISAPTLSIVAPLYNECESVAELTARCIATARHFEVPFELILVDDASTDGTLRALADLSTAADYRQFLRIVHLSNNIGQYATTIAGLQAARGELVVVLDGDLQDPPEVIAAMLTRAAEVPEAEVVFAVKRSRDDALWMRGACGALRALLAVVSAANAVGGAGSFCLMRRSVVDRAIAVPIKTANLAAVLASLHPVSATVNYHKAARAHGESRVGLWGLIREGLGSLAVTGSLRRLAWSALAVAALVGTVSAVAVFAL